MPNLSLNNHEPLGEGLRRIVASHLAHLHNCLAAEGEDIAKAVHDARTTCKKLRAVHRLASGKIGRKKSRKADKFYRDLARQLSEARDAHVMPKTLGAVGGEDAFPKIGESLRKHEEQAAKAESKLVGTMDHLRDSLLAHKQEFPFPEFADEFGVIEKGLLEIYAEGRALFEAAHRDPKPAMMHEWRKRAKDMLYITQLLRPLWPAEFRAHAKEWKRLTDLLGEEHDATVLIKASAKKAANKAEAKELRARLTQRREDLRGECWPIAMRLYAEPVHIWRDRIEVMWGACKSERVKLPKR